MFPMGVMYFFVSNINVHICNVFFSLKKLLLSGEIWMNWTCGVLFLSSILRPVPPKQIRKNIILAKPKIRQLIRYVFLESKRQAEKQKVLQNA